MGGERGSRPARRDDGSSSSEDNSPPKKSKRQDSSRSQRPRRDDDREESSSHKDRGTPKKPKRQDTGRSHRSKRDEAEEESSESENIKRPKQPRRADTGRSQRSQRDEEKAYSAADNHGPLAKLKRQDTNHSQRSRRDTERAEPSSSKETSSLKKSKRVDTEPSQRSQVEVECEKKDPDVSADAEDSLEKVLQHSKADDEARKSKQLESGNDDDLEKVMGLSLQESSNLTAAQKEEAEFQKALEMSMRTHEEAQQQPPPDEDFDAEILKAIEASKATPKTDKKARNELLREEKAKIKYAKNITLSEWKAKDAYRQEYMAREIERKKEIQEEDAKIEREDEARRLANENRLPSRQDPGDDDPRVQEEMRRAFAASLSSAPPPGDVLDEGVVKDENVPPTYQLKRPAEEKRGDPFRFVSSSSNPAIPGTWKTITPAIEEIMEEFREFPPLHYFHDPNDDFQCPQGWDRRHMISRGAKATAKLMHGGTRQDFDGVHGPLPEIENHFRGPSRTAEKNQVPIGQGRSFDRVREIRVKKEEEKKRKEEKKKQKEEEKKKKKEEDKKKKKKKSTTT